MKTIYVLLLAASVVFGYAAGSFAAPLPVDQDDGFEASVPDVPDHGPFGNDKGDSRNGDASDNDNASDR